MRYIFLFIGILLCMACHQDTPPASTPKEAIFFDLPAFFHQEIDLLQKDVIGLQKTATINGQKETKQISEFDLKQELSSFINADINKATWKDQYQVDSIWQAQQLQSIHYKALNKKLKTQKVLITFEEGEVAAIEIEKGIDNMAVRADQVLTYFSRQGYKVNKEQSLVLSDPQKIEMEVKFIR